MAYVKTQFSDGLQHGQILRRALSNLELGREGLEDIVAAMALMIDGDGSNVSHFGEVTSRFGFVEQAGAPSGTTAKAAFEELNSLLFKLTTNASVTDVLNAQTQAYNKFR